MAMIVPTYVANQPIKNLSMPVRNCIISVSNTHGYWLRSQNIGVPRAIQDLHSEFVELFKEAGAAVRD